MRQLPQPELRVDATLRLNPFTRGDAPRLVELVDDAELRCWLPLPDPYTLEVAESWCTTFTEEAREQGRGLTLALRHGDELAGCIDLKRVDWRARTAEIGYWTAHTHRGRGLMPAAVGTLTEWMLHDQAFERVELRIATLNTGSIRVAEKAGFIYEGTARNAGFTDAGRVDLQIWSRIPGDRPTPTSPSGA